MIKLFQLSSRFFRFLLVFIFVLPIKTSAQEPKTYTAAEIQLALQKMQVLGSVLYVGAHPDDENNSLLAYLALGALYRTAYLAATRGDGGQNHIGDEQGASLGILRTQELLAARRIDGAEQFFSSAIDFGYNTSPEETFRKWGREEILADFVWVIRNYKPDIIIARFPTTGEGTHGHHTASAILAKEAFRAAGDPKRFPEQLEYVEAWQPKRLFWNAFPRVIQARGGDPEKLIKIDIGGFNSLLGKSYTEIGAEARSMHKCQGMGTLKSRGSDIEYFELLDGEPAVNGLFEGIDISWSRIPNGAQVARLIDKAQSEFQPAFPEKSIPTLMNAYLEIEKLAPNNWILQKKKELKNIIAACAGLWFEAIAEDYSVATGDKLQVRARIINRSDIAIELKSFEVSGFTTKEHINEKLAYNKPVEKEFSVAISENMKISQPYWLQKPPNPGRFAVEDQKLIGAAENSPVMRVLAELNIGGHAITFETPVTYGWRDQFDGDRYRPLEVVPKVTANIEEPAYIFADGQPQNLRVRLKSGVPQASGKINLELPEGWNSNPENIAFDLAKKEDESLVSFSVTPPAAASEGAVKAIVEMAGERTSFSLVRIDYKHVPIQSYFPPAESRIVRLDLHKTERKIGYVMGAGDLVPQSLEQIGYKVTLLTDSDLEKGDLSIFDTIITGVRAYSTRHRLRQLHKRLLDFVFNGGTLVMQYNSNRGNVVENLGPYPMHLSFDRVDEEVAPVAIVNPSHPLMNMPNKITLHDFEGWVHDRGLYFANEFDKQYDTILSSHDSGKPATEGGMLYAKYGKGIFIYAGYSFFRQLPAGVPGAYRLFVNLISAGK